MLDYKLRKCADLAAIDRVVVELAIELVEDCKWISRLRARRLIGFIDHDLRRPNDAARLRIGGHLQLQRNNRFAVLRSPARFVPEQVDGELRPVKRGTNKI